LCLAAGLAQANVIIGQDNFDGATNYLTKVNSQIRNTETVMWGEVSRATVVSTFIIDTSVQAGGVVALNTEDNLGFLQSTKTDSFFAIYRAGSRTLTYTFNIAGYTNLNLAMDWAATGDIADPSIFMTYSIDGAVATEIFRIGTQNVKWTETMENAETFERNRSGTAMVNGVAGSHLTDVFQTYNPTIAGAGSVLTVTLTQASTLGNIAFGMDNLVLNGTVIPEPATIGMLGLGALITLVVRRMNQ